MRPANLAISNIENTPNEAAREAENLIRSSSYPALWRVSWGVREGKLVLRGQVPSYHLKQVAQTLVRSQTTEVDNEIRVVELKP